MKEYISDHRLRFLKELFALLQIPSISADTKYKKDIRKAAEYVCDLIKDAGSDKAVVIETFGHPIVYGEKIVDENKPTVLVYGHYDVQPPDPIKLWETPPFEPTIRDEKIYARGACDDKGQFFMHIKALEAMLKTELLSCNVKFLIEGEEEVGSKNLATFVKENKEMLKADIILISDTALISLDQPSITTGLRGLSYLEVEVTGPNRDLHSGVYGGAIANPINVLCETIASLINEKGRVTIPGFYDKVVELSEKERKEINKAPFNLEAFKNELEVEQLRGENGYTIVEQTGIRPTLDVNGIWGGYIGQGAKTVIPSKAYAKISMRLVPNQEPQEISDLFTKHITSIVPKSVKVKVTHHHGAEPALTQTSSKAYKAASKAFEEVWGKPPIPTRDGGSIPVVSLFNKELGLQSVLLGFGLNSDAIHSPNEHFGIKNFFIGIETIIAFYKYFSEAED